MPDALSAIQAAMNADMARLEAVNNNIANLHTPGFRRQMVDMPADSLPQQPDMSHVRQSLQTVSATAAGTLQHTGNPYHLALSGEGYFVIRTDNGTFYSRRGDCERDRDGRLISIAGGFLEGDNGEITLSDGRFQVDSHGTVLSTNGSENRLRLVRFDHPEHLQDAGNGLLTTAEPPQDATPAVLQGTLERANVQSVDEMLTLMRISRHFEASQRVLRTLTSLQSSAINQLGDNNV